MHKFLMPEYSKEELDKFNQQKPFLYKVYFGKNYILHKSKNYPDGLNRLLDDVYRGMRGKSHLEHNTNVIAHCNRYPGINKVAVEMILNDDPDKILKEEKRYYREMKLDPLSLNRFDIPPYQPEWMLKQISQERCGDGEKCITSGMVDRKKTKFKFCPKCGRLNK